MHISNLVNQYQRNNTNSTEELKGATSMQKLVSAVGELTQGSVFEGTVTSVRGNKVTLSLSTGQTISAHLEEKVPLRVGTPMFFKVKSNSGNILAIKPYTENGSGGNPILMNALTSAGVPLTERNLEMVKAMMHQQMPISKQSILDMIKHVSANEQTSVQTIVDMTRLGLPVDTELAAQFEAYGKGNYEILSKLNSAADQVLELLSSEEVYPNKSVELNHKLVDMLLNPESASQSNFANQTLQQVFTGEQLEYMTKLLQNTPTLVDNPNLFITENGAEIFVDTMLDTPEGKNAMVSGEMEVFNEAAVSGEAVEGEEAVVTKQVLNTDLTVEKFLRSIQEAFIDRQEFGFAGAQKLFGSEEYQSVLKELLQEEWLLKPEELEGEQVKETFKKLLKQTGQLEQMVRSTGLEQPQFLQTTADIQSNVEFMNQLNQVYTYVQLPLKLSGQNANGDLYVYTNKKNLNDPDAELSAFLHLDLEHLGATDVSVKMLRKHVNTNFYFSDDASYALVQKYLPILEEKLKQKGYNCTLTVTNEEKKIDFVQDFLRKDLPATGMLHRYSFDVRT